jgi:antitoxin component of MazEF toxin-antitoxin module
VTTTDQLTLALRRERTNKHTVRYVQRDCDDSAAAPCPSVTLPKEAVERLGLSDTDDLHVRVYSSERAAAPVASRRESETLRERLDVADLAEVSLIYEQLMLEADEQLAEAIGSRALADVQADRRTEQLPAPSELGKLIVAEIERQAAQLQPAEQPDRRLDFAPIDVPELAANEVHDCSCGATGSKAEPACGGHPHTGSGD